MNYLLTGSGGREHALAWKLSQSECVTHIYCMPGNAGTASTAKTSNIPAMEIAELLDWALQHKIDRLLVGSEDLLVQGIVDQFSQAGIETLGPHKIAAQLEGSKSFAKKFMDNNAIRTAQYKTFTDYSKALAYVTQAQYPLVVKADGLAAGKGVLITKTVQEAVQALNLIMQEEKFGNKQVVIEEYLQGFEVSVISLYDGKTIIPLLSAKDHKKIFDGEQGKNTGGMGVVVPNPLFTEAHNADFIQHILLPTQKGLEKALYNFSGVIFFGLMVQNDICYLLEYNVRFGDPEIQAILAMLKSDLHSHISNCLAQQLQATEFKWKQGAACCVVLASEGYPDVYNTGIPININADLASNIFAAGAQLESTLDSGQVKKPSHKQNSDHLNNQQNNTQKDTQWLTSGGRVLNVVASADTLVEAQNLAYADIEKIHFDGKYYRTDIGK